MLVSSMFAPLEDVRGLVLCLLLISHAALFSATLSTSLRAVPRARPVWPHAVCLADRAGGNFYHFHMMNIAGLEAYVRPGFSVVLRALFNTTPFQRDTFALLAPEFIFDGGPPGEVAYRCEKEFFRTDGYAKPFVAEPRDTWCAEDDYALPTVAQGCEFSLGVFGLGDSPMDHWPPAAHLFFRSFFRRKLALRRMLPTKLDPRALYYVLRNTTGAREILNEAEFLPCLHKIGFKTIRLEELSTLEKLRFYASARAVISGQSAGLTFSVVMDVRALMIEIFPRDAPQPMRQYMHMVEDAGVPHRRYDEVDVVKSPVALFDGMYGIFNMRVRSPAAFCAFVAAELNATDARARGP